jgi:hypothetical protein
VESSDYFSRKLPGPKCMTEIPAPHELLRLITASLPLPLLALRLTSPASLRLVTRVLTLLANSYATNANAAKGAARRFWGRGSVNHATTRTRLIAVAIRMCWRCVFAKPR